ncbi:MAG: hypothetical protein L0332_12620 [Chloroflexi bacterium]|nr:hypothetical protein [Chloroflexota bacterium]MCI0644231.1 hypothetical protein [Chloroflexota bacterium]MCI0727550.1 hypothetical protein [Chloroflexota bacterium]
MYGERFPAYAAWKEGAGGRGVGGDYRFYRFVVDRVKIFDEQNLGEGLFVEAAVRRKAIGR